MNLLPPPPLLPSHPLPYQYIISLFLLQDGDPVEDSPIVTPGKSSDTTSGEAADDQQPSTSTAPPPTPPSPSTPQEHPHEGQKEDPDERLINNVPLIDFYQ